MSETNWPELHDKTLRYQDQTWKLTGEVDVRDRGTILAVTAIKDDDVRREEATLYFESESGEDSLNPGNLGEHFDRLETTERHQYLIVKKERRTYRYELRRLEYA